jgi:hypothetical protein
MPPDTKAMRCVAGFGCAPEGAVIVALRSSTLVLISSSPRFASGFRF